MATKKITAPDSGAPKQAVERPAERPASREPVYTAEEFAAGAKQVFGTGPDCVSAALKAAHIKSCTISEARKIVKAFTEKEVK